MLAVKMKNLVRKGRDLRTRQLDSMMVKFQMEELIKSYIVVGIFVITNL